MSRRIYSIKLSVTARENLYPELLIAKKSFFAFFFRWIDQIISEQNEYINFFITKVYDYGKVLIFQMIHKGAVMSFDEFHRRILYNICTNIFSFVTIHKKDRLS